MGLEAEEPFKTTKSTQTTNFGKSQIITLIEKMLNVRIMANMLSILMDHTDMISSVQFRVLS